MVACVLMWGGEAALQDLILFVSPHVSAHAPGIRCPSNGIYRVSLPHPGCAVSRRLQASHDSPLVIFAGETLARFGN